VIEGLSSLILIKDRNVSIYVGTMIRRPDIYDPAEANTRNVENLKKQLSQSEEDFYE